MKIIIGILIAIATILVIGFVPTMEVLYNETVQYQGTETYYVNEPYEDTETYYVDVPYEVIDTYIEAVPLSYGETGYLREDVIEQHQQIIIGGMVFQDKIVEVPIQVACVNVANTDDIAGSFTVSFSGITPMFGELSLTQTLNLSPGEAKVAECPAESANYWRYTITPSTKAVEKQRMVTEYRKVEQERTVTKYKQLEKTRTVTMERAEPHRKKVPIFEYLLSQF